MAGENGSSVIWDSETIGVVENGSAGKGISSVVNYYAATNSNDSSLIPADAWKTSISATGHGNKLPYLWNYEEINYTDGSSTKLT